MKTMRSIFETDFTSVTLCWARIPDQPRLHFSLKYSQKKQPQTNQGRLKINCTMSLALTFRLQYDPYVKHGEKQQHHCTAFPLDCVKVMQVVSTACLMTAISTPDFFFGPPFLHLSVWAATHFDFSPVVACRQQITWFFTLRIPFLCLPSLLSKKQKSVSPNCSVT